MTKNKCIVVLCISSFFKRHLIEVYPMLKKYSDKCNADLIVHDTPPDPNFRHNLMSQKLLIPGLYKKYGHILMLDLDIFISDNCPNIFDDLIDDNVGFSAVENPINSNEYKYICEHVWGIPHTNHMQQNPYTGTINNKIKGINGGVMYFNSSLIADLLRQFYFDDSTKWCEDTAIMNNEETPVWWIADNNDMFLSMDKQYNYQMFYHLSNNYKDLIGTYKGFKGKLYRKASQKLPMFVTNNIFGPRYKESVSDAIDSSNIVHFAGGFPYPYFKL